MKLNLLLFFLLTLLTAGCMKVNEGPTTYYIPSRLKEYSIFKKDSYWVYKNETTGKEDSSYLLYQPDFSYNHEGGYEYDDIFEKCSVFYGGDFFNHATISNVEYFLALKSYNYVAINPSSFTPGDTLIIEPRIKLINLPFIDSLLFDDTIFHDVFVTKYLYFSQQNDTSYFISYFAKKVGLIRLNHKELAGDTTWTLIRYKTIQ